MLLNEFINRYIPANSIIRLVTKVDGGYSPISKGSNWNDVSMEWEILKDYGIYKGMGKREVLGIVSIDLSGVNTSAINIVIESDVEFRDRMIRIICG